MDDTPSLAQGRRLAFADCRLDLSAHRLWRGDREVALRPKSWDVLRYLVERPGVLVTKDALHREIWPDAVVSDDTLTKSIGELRQALADDPRAPRFIETVHGRGFRFIAEMRGIEGSSADARQGFEPAAVLPAPTPTFVGRGRELARLDECLRQAARGARQIVFVTGEAGIGKTTLAEEFLRSPAVAGAHALVLHGQCIQQYGEREPYMPMLEAVERLLGSPAGAPLIPALRRVAPCWYVQIPWLLSEGEPAGFHGAMLSPPPQRMLREMGAFLESVAAHAPVILVLEDLHWSDHATADLVSFLGERRDPARLLVVATYRPADASAHEHPVREVKRTLRSHRRAIELALDYLTRGAVREYLARRFGGAVQDLAPLIHQRTDGNPLFVAAIVEELIRRGQLVETGDGWAIGSDGDRVDVGVPEDLVEMFTAQLDRLGADQRAVLEAASVAGASATAATVARALGSDADDVEAVAQQLERSHLFLSAAGRPEDRGGAAPYGFTHALHRQVIYEQMSDARRRRLHQSVGLAIESAAGDRLGEVAPELSVHFEQSRDWARATRYLAQCVARARQRFAYREAVTYGLKTLALLRELPEALERDRAELDVRLLMGHAMGYTRGYTSPEVERNYERARDLCGKVGADRQLFEIIHAAWYRALGNADAEATGQAVEELATIAERLGPDFRWRAKLARGRLELWGGRFGAAAPILLECIEEIERGAVDVGGEAYGVDPVLGAFAQGGIALWFIGRPAAARALEERGRTLAEKSGRPFDLASMLCHSGFVELQCGSLETTAAFAERARAISADNDIAFFLPLSRSLLGAVAAAGGDAAGGAAEIIAALATQREIGGVLLTDFQLASIARALGAAGRWDEGIRTADEGIAVTERPLGRIFAAEMWRVKGELILGKARASRRALAGGTVAAARDCFERALATAREQGATSIELRTAMSLARLPQPPAAAAAAREQLRNLYAAFTEGFDTRDLEDTRALLASLDR